MTTTTLEEKDIKALFKQAMVELLEERRDLFQEIFLEALEDFGLRKAIEEGESSELIDNPFADVKQVWEREWDAEQKTVWQNP